MDRWPARSVSGKLALLRGTPPAVSASLAAAALRWAESDEMDALADATLSVPTAANVAAVIGVLHHLRSETMHRLQEPQIAVEPALGMLRSRQQLLNGIAVARRRGEPQLLAQLVGYLDAPYEDVPRRAAGAILEIVTTHAGRDGRRRMDDRTAAAIDDAVATAVVGADHRLDAIFLAAAVLAPRPGRRLASLLADPHHPMQFSIRRVVGRTDHSLVRHNLLRWLTTGALRAQVARSLHRVRDHAGLLECGHLLLQPSRRRALRHVDRPLRCLPEATAASALPAAAQVNLVRYVRALPIGREAKRARLAECAKLPSPAARLHALLGLIADGGDDAGRVVETMCTDADPAVACLAAGRVLVPGRRPGPELLRTLETSAHPAIARRATAAVSATGVDAFLDRWLRLDDADRVAVARGLLRSRRDTLIGGLGRALARGGRHERLAAITLANRLGVTADLEPDLIAAAAGDDPRVASAAVTALSRSFSPRALHAVRTALDHADRRVQANALEALTRLDRAAIDRLQDRLDSRDNRVRANAVRAMLRRRGGDGPVTLRRMLGDADPRHRVSAIWVAGRAREGRVSEQLRRIADQDEIAEIRRRATATAEWIGR